MTTDPRRAPHPVQLEVDYPERLSRWLIFVKLILVIPHLLAVYVLFIAVALLTFFAWIGMLITGRYPKAFFEFTTGILRWFSNIYAYMGLLRDEYPPFSWEPGRYPLALTIPMAERQSRFRLFIRWFSVIPNYIVLYFVQIGWYFTTFIAWWAILFTGRYPRGLFRFSVGVMRWQARQYAYLLLFRDEYPPYSLSANARPGNEVVSAILGAPLGAAYMTYYVSFSLLPLLSGPKRVDVDAALLESPAALERAAPHGTVGGLKITLIGYEDRARLPDGASSDRPLGLEGAHLESFRVRAEKDGWTPIVYTPFAFSAEPCVGQAQQAFSAIFEDNDWIEFMVFGGEEESTIYFWVDGFSICRLSYWAAGRPLNFDFQ